MLVLIFVSGLSYKILAPVIVMGIPLGVVLFWYIQQPYNVLLKHYQYKRIMAWLHPETDVKGTINYQQNRSIRAIASGGLYGKFFTGTEEQKEHQEHIIPLVSMKCFIWSVIGRMSLVFRLRLDFISLCIYYFQMFFSGQKLTGLFRKTDCCRSCCNVHVPGVYEYFRSYIDVSKHRTPASVYQ